MTSRLKEPDLLLTALRQYNHNHGEGFVFGYDKEETDRIVTGLVEVLEEMIDVVTRVDSWESFPSDPVERAEDAIRAYRKQGGDL